MIPDILTRWPATSLRLVTMPTQWQWTVNQYLFVSLYQVWAQLQANEKAAFSPAVQAAESHIRNRVFNPNRETQQLRRTSITEEPLDVITRLEVLTTG